MVKRVHKTNGYYHINNHKFINGEKIYLKISPNSGITGSSGYYYLKVIDDNNLNLFVRRSFSEDLWLWINDSARFL